MRNLFSVFRKTYSVIKTSVFPENCVICLGETKDGKICKFCDLHLDTAVLKNPVFTVQRDEQTLTCAACFDYKSEKVSKLVFALKDTGNRELVNYITLKMLMLPKLLCIPDKSTVFTSVPRSYAGMYKYGFDQAQLLAKRAALLDNEAKYKCLLVRRGISREQKKLGAKDRKKNVSGKFRVTRMPGLTKAFDGNIVIFDDVCTTASSVLECAKVLKDKFKNANIYAVFLARNDI